MRREELDGGVEPVRLFAEAEVEVVVVHDAREAEEAVERPDEERGPEVRAVVVPVRVKVASEEENSGKNGE